ncbi:MAG TPA: plastocyanin/azurin family copper-binding protein [Solirubrobacterales bacterium]
MSNETLFFIFGIALAVSAVTVSLIGLRSEKFPGKKFPLVILWFAILMGGATTFAVLHAKDEDKAKAAELAAANKKITKDESSPEPAQSAPAGKAPAEPKPAEAAAKGPGGTLKLSADPTQLAFNTKTLTSKPGKVTIDFDNPSALQHDVVIEKDGKEIAGTSLIAEGKASVTADLAPGTYTFLCNVPGHAEAGMEGTLTVK